MFIDKDNTYFQTRGVLHEHVTVFLPPITLYPSCGIQITILVTRVVVNFNHYEYSVPNVDHHIPRVSVHSRYPIVVTLIIAKKKKKKKKETNGLKNKRKEKDKR